MSAATAAARAGPRWDERIRIETVAPLAIAYFALAVLYAWQAWQRDTPTIFTDELEMTQISRSIADTGLPGRRGESYGFTTLVPWLTAPFWWIEDVPTAYATIKYVQALVMATAIIPAYLLARLVVSRPWAIVAAVGSIAAPALSYAPILVEEAFAYPAATLALWLCVRAVARPGWRSFGLAFAACVLATAIRSQLVALFAALVVPYLVLGWRSEPMRRFRATWSGWDWAGAVALGVGAVLLVMAAIGHLSADWAEVMALWKGRIVQYGVWAAGAFAIGIGILPAIAMLAAFVRPRTELREPKTLAFVLVGASAVGSLGFYAGLKGAYVSTTFSSLVVERNLIYLAPLAFVATVLLLERRNPRPWAIAAATAIVLYLVVDTPMRLDQYPYYEAHGLAILAFANRVPKWSESTIEWWLIGIALVSGALLLGLALARARRLVAALGVGIAAFTLTWNLGAEIYAANGERDLSDRFGQGIADPPNWIDEATNHRSTVLLGQQFGTDYNGIHLTEFFNRSIGKVWSVDPLSHGPPPGPTTTPDLVGVDGTLAPAPGTEYVAAVNGVRLQGEVVARRRDGTTVYRLAGPLKLAENQTGVYPDGWMGDHAAYNRFDVSRDGFGFASVKLSRTAFCPLQDDGTILPLPSRITVRIGPLRIGADKQPALGRTSDMQTLRVPPCQSLTVLLRPPASPWRIEVDAQTFVPAEVDPRSSERRSLGARVNFGFLPL